MSPLPLPAITILLVVTLGYLGWCRISPFGRCRRCRSTGARHRHGKPVRPRLFTRPGRRVCRRCKGTGMRLRRGTRLINHARQIHHDATH